jgi:hypothetical protein
MLWVRLMSKAMLVTQSLFEQAGLSETFKDL